jgi:hypothetical protein
VRALPAIALFGALFAGCTVDTPTAFGLRCTNPDICDGLQCRPSPDDGELRCLPPRGPAEPGEQCTAPFVTTSPGTGAVILDQLVYLGAATDDVKLSCSALDAPEVVVRFKVADDDGDPATEAPGVRIRLDGDNADHFALSLRATGCGDELAFGCKAPGGSDILLEALPAGDYELVVEGTATGSGTDETPAHVIVERLDCPANALPFDTNTCIRTVRLGANLAARVGHSVHVLDDGSIVVIGGDSGNGPRPDFEVLDPGDVLRTRRFKHGGRLTRRPRVHQRVVLQHADLAQHFGAPNPGLAC